MYDLLLKNGLVVDGVRTKPYPANVYIQDGRIAKITQEDNLEAKETLGEANVVVK